MKSSLAAYTVVRGDFLDFCVCCGAYVPEGMMVCLQCQMGAKNMNAIVQTDLRACCADRKKMITVQKMIRFCKK